MPSALQPESYTKREFESLLAELIRTVKATRPVNYTDFFESNLGTMLMELIAGTGDILSYGMDAVSVELFLATCKRYESALRFAQSVGYRPRGPVGAIATMSIVSMPAAVSADGGLIAAGSKFVGTNGLQYEVLETAVINPGDTTSQIDVTEGRSAEEVFDASGIANQEINTATKNVADSTWTVFVGDPTDPDNYWTEVASLALENGATKTYEVRYNPDNSIIIRFGNGLDAGKIPDGDITVRMRTVNGARGNVPASAVRGSVVITLINSVGTVESQYTSVTNASGGLDRESVDDLRATVPAYLRSADKIVTRADYNLNVRRVPGVAVSLTDVIVNSYGGNLVVTYAWGLESLRSPTNPFVVESYVNPVVSAVDYDRYAVLDIAFASAIQQFLRARTVLTVHNVIQRPDLAEVDVYLSDVRYDRRFAPTTVHRAIAEAVVALFRSSSGFEIRLSDLFEAIDSVDGVRSFYIERVLVSQKSKGFATGTITFSGNNNPSDGETLTIDDGTSVTIFEFDSNTLITPGRILVPIGGSAAATMVNLVNLVNAHTKIFAGVNGLSAIAAANLTHTQPGSLYNLPITETGVNIAVTGMTGGDDTVIIRHKDFRRDVNPGVDNWPAGVNPLPPLPVTHPDYATKNGPGDGIVPYLPLQDVIIEEAYRRQNFYDDTYLYNNEIYYDSSSDLATAIQVLNLRSLHFELVQG